MSAADRAQNTSNRDLVLTRIIDAARDKVFRAWTQPELLQQWFAPAPWITSRVETDVRPGGASLIVMRSPDGKEFPSRGVYLEVVENELLVFTAAHKEPRSRKLPHSCGSAIRPNRPPSSIRRSSTIPASSALRVIRKAPLRPRGPS